MLVLPYWMWGRAGSARAIQVILLANGGLAGLNYLGEVVWEKKKADIKSKYYHTWDGEKHIKHLF